MSANAPQNNPSPARARRVGVVRGGLSAERDVSLDSGAGVLVALRERGYDCVDIDWAPETSLPQLLTDHGVEVVWNALHGTYGEDGAIQGLCSCMDIICTGSGILASAMAMDKVSSKRVFANHGLPTAPWHIVASDADTDAALSNAMAAWGLPLVVKPGNEGSSVGITIVREPGQFADAVAKARACRGPTLIERYIPGTEVCVGILGREVLGALEIRPGVEFYDYAAKYQRDDTQYLVPPPLSPDLVSAAERISLQAYEALGCSGYGRVDMRVDIAAGEQDPDSAISLLEVNTLPGMTSHSLLPKIAAHVGIDYATLCERILEYAIADAERG